MSSVPNTNQNVIGEAVINVRAVGSEIASQKIAEVRDSLGKLQAQSSIAGSSGPSAPYELTGSYELALAEQARKYKGSLIDSSAVAGNGALLGKATPLHNVDDSYDIILRNLKEREAAVNELGAKELQNAAAVGETAKQTGNLKDALHAAREPAQFLNKAISTIALPALIGQQLAEFIDQQRDLKGKANDTISDLVSGLQAARKSVGSIIDPDRESSAAQQISEAYDSAFSAINEKISAISVAIENARAKTDGLGGSVFKLEADRLQGELDNLYKVLESAKKQQAATIEEAERKAKDRKEKAFDDEVAAADKAAQETINAEVGREKDKLTQLEDLRLASERNTYSDRDKIAAEFEDRVQKYREEAAADGNEKVRQSYAELIRETLVEQLYALDAYDKERRRRDEDAAKALQQATLQSYEQQSRLAQTINDFFNKSFRSTEALLQMGGTMLEVLGELQDVNSNLHRIRQ